MSRRWARLLGGAAILALVAALVGPRSFVAGVRALHPADIVAALLVAAAATLCYAWRWRRVARLLGHDLPLREAVVAYCRSQFLNATLPLGVAGDVHRAVRHGAAAVALERGAGLAAQVALAALALMLLPAPVSWPVLLPVAAGAAGLLVVLARRASMVVLASSGLALAGHLAVFVVATRAVGVVAPLPVLLGLTLLALLAMAVPLGVAGWGPREGVAAWAFAAAGLGATAGVAAAVAYGLLSLVGVLPGAITLLVAVPEPEAA